MSIHEQPARAAMLKEVIGAKIVPLRDLSAGTLAAAIKDAADSPTMRSKVPAQWFGGGAVLDKTLTELFGP
jgi:hypothetical protein